jgi:hypothetical protein
MSSWYAESRIAASDSPLSTALELSSLVELSSKIQEVDLSRGLFLVGDDYERVDLEVAMVLCQQGTKNGRVLVTYVNWQST